MRKVLVLFVIVSFLLPAMAFAQKKEYPVGGIVDNIKVYDAGESHGYIMRVDIKRSNDKIKKVYIKKSTKIVDGGDKEIALNKIKKGKVVQALYVKSGNDFVATKITVP